MMTAAVGLTRSVRAGWLLAVALLALPNGASAQRRSEWMWEHPSASTESARLEAQIIPRPRTLGAGERTLQIAAGAAGAWLGGMGAWAVIDDPESPDRKVKGDSGYQPNANTAYAIGSWVGSTLAVYATGRAFEPKSGSLAGTAIGTGIVSAFLLLGREEPWLPLIGLAVAPLQAIGGAIGFRR